MAQHILNLPCTASCYTDIDNPNTNYSGSVIKAGKRPVGTGYGDSVFKHAGYAKFNDSSLPLRKKITDITLKYYLSYKESTFTDGLVILELRSTDADLNISTINYSNTYVYPKRTSRAFNSSSTIPSFYQNSLNVLSAKVANFTTDYPEQYAEIQGYGSANPPVLIVTYEDVPPDQPTLTVPIGIFTSNNEVIRFSWNYNSSVGGVQKAFDLLWSDDGTTWTTVSQTTANNYYDMPADTLPSGNIYWKVKTYNEYDEASPESTVSTFYAIGAPATPNIVSITSGTARPTVSWTSTNQQVYQIQILQDSNVIFDSSDIASISIKSHKVTEFLQDGNYTAQVRIKNEYDLWSEWASIGFTLTTTKPTKPTLALVRKKYNITTISNIGTNSYLLLYRSDYGQNNYKCIYKSTTNDIIDNKIESNKKYQYFVRAVNSSEAYNDSDILDVYAPTINKSIISPISDLNNVFEINYNLGERPTKNLTTAMVTTSNYFTGRENSVTEFSEHSSQSVNLGFYIKLDTNYNQLADIINLKDIVLYRDGRRKFYGTISGFENKDHRAGYIIGFSVTQVDFDEEIEV
jgi:hypothetical protein